MSASLFSFVASQVLNSKLFGMQVALDSMTAMNVINTFFTLWMEEGNSEKKVEITQEELSKYVSEEEQKGLTQDQQILAYQMRKIAQDFDENKFAFKVIGKQYLRVIAILFALPMSLNLGYAAKQGTIPFLKQMGSYLLP